MYIMPEGENCIFSLSQITQSLSPIIPNLNSAFISYKTLFQQQEAGKFSKNTLCSFVVYLTTEKWERIFK